RCGRRRLPWTHDQAEAAAPARGLVGLPRLRPQREIAAVGGRTRHLWRMRMPFDTHPRTSVRTGTVAVYSPWDEERWVSEPPISVRPPKAPVDARPGRSGRTCLRAGWTPASSTPAGNRCCRRPNSTSLEDENALRHSPAHLGADGDRGGLFAMVRRAVGERTG